MIPSKKNMITIKYGEEELCQIDGENPDLSEFVNVIINNDNLEPNKITCTTGIDNFDKESFTQILKESANMIKEKMSSERDSYEKIIKTITYDKQVKEFYDEFIKNASESAE